MEAIHSKKPIREKASSPKYTLAQFHKLQTKEFFNLWTFTTPPLKANLFLSFQIVQKIHNGMEFYIFFLFLPTKRPLQQNNTSLTVSGNTHWTPNKAKTISQRALTTVQCKRMWFTFSSSQPHKKQRFGSCHPRFCSLSNVRIFSQVTSHAKKTTLVGTLSTQMLFFPERRGDWGLPAYYKPPESEKYQDPLLSITSSPPLRISWSPLAKEATLLLTPAASH